MPHRITFRRLPPYVVSAYRPAVYSADPHARRGRSQKRLDSRCKSLYNKAGLADRLAPNRRYCEEAVPARTASAGAGARNEAIDARREFD